MRVSRKINSLALIAVVATFGCSQSYNGAISTKDQKTIEAYSRFKQQQTQTTAVEKTSTTRQQTQTTTTAQQDVRFASERSQTVQAAEPVQIQLISDTEAAADTAGAEHKPRRVSSLNLFGQIESPRESQTSPMDGPDNLTRVTFSTEGSDFDPDIDPVGELMVFASTRHRETSDIYLKRVDGTTITQLTNDPARDSMPAFSPDGKRIAFASDRSGNWDIYLMDVTGGQAVQITNDPTQDLHPSFSPDGKRLVYCTYGTTSGQWEMVVVDLENPGAKQFIGHGLFPTWSPTQDKILFQRARQRGTRWFSIWTVDLVNGEAVMPTEIAASSNAAVITPDWSPDGKHIVFCTVIDPTADDQKRPQDADVWVIAADGTHRARLTNGQFANLQPVWAEDGTIYFVSDRAGQGVENVWAIRPDRAIQLARPSDTPGDPSAMVPTEQ